MRAVIQRAAMAAVKVDGEIVGEIKQGLLVLLGVAIDDDESDASFMVEKILGLRIFQDDQGKMNLSVTDMGGDVLVVSQFTLCGDARKGRRPSFTYAAPPEKGEALYERCVNMIQARGVPVRTGRFGAMMQVELVNDGPVTILLDTKKTF